MGYEYDLQGWCTARRTIDLEAFRASHANAIEFAAFQVAGRGRNILLFAADGKSVQHDYLTPIPRLMEAFGGGHGIVTVTGEIGYDGKDRTILVSDAKLMTVPLHHVYAAGSPWNALYDACHHMAHGEKAQGPCVAADLSSLAACVNVRGWLQLGREMDSPALTELCGSLERLCPDLRGGIVAVDYYYPVLMFGQDDLDVATVVRAIAAVTADFPRAFGVLYCSANSDKRQQVPVRVEHGEATVLPAVSIDPADQDRHYPVQLPVYAGLGDGAAYVNLRGPAGLDKLYAALAPLHHAADGVVAPRDDQALEGRSYRFEACGLVCEISLNALGPVERDHEYWPFQLRTYLDSGAQPRVLADRVLELARRLTALGVELEPTDVHFSFRSYVSIPSGEVVDRD